MSVSELWGTAVNVSGQTARRGGTVPPANIPGYIHSESCEGYAEMMVASLSGRRVETVFVAPERIRDHLVVMIQPCGWGFDWYHGVI
jgi:hypothetical protein